ncbi:hypothetical protein ACFQ4C_30170 [Larkinella insperata]|uniref:Outer membrane protein beta-barrel domain-containing protein n=1 Tax=Larkinella insperata TaxID=332158 RepID=A0ABW3QL20_9BACT
MKKLLLFTTLCLSYFFAKAQQQIFKNTVRFNIESTNKRANTQHFQRAIARYSVSYDRNLGSKAWSIEGTLGYMQNYIREDLYGREGSYTGTRSKRIYMDFSFLYDLLPRDRHSLRIGGGPSAWYQQNAIANDVTVWVKPGTIQEVDYIEVRRTKKSEVVAGFNLQAAYDYSVLPRLLVGARVVGLSNLTKMHSLGAIGYNYLTIGMSVGYRF